MTETVLKPVQKEGALLVSSRDLLVLADLHIGIEYALYQEGVHVGSRVDLLVEKVRGIVDEYDVREMLVLGDVKHVVPGSPRSQRVDLLRFFEEFKDLSLHVVPGNHDGGIHKFIPREVEIHPSKGWVIEEGVGFVHGHRWPDENVFRCSTVVAAHTHPSVMLKDKMGYRFFERCWVNSKLDVEKARIRYPSALDCDVVFMPAFNPLCGGLAVNVNGVIGPLGKIVDVDSSEVYLLDGSFLGRVSDLR